MNVLVYHRVCAEEEAFRSTYVVSRSAFRRHLRALADGGYYTPRLGEALHGTPPSVHGRKPIMITFDDGYADNYHNAFPLLHEHGFSAVIFLVADVTRRTNWWDTPLGVPAADLLTPSQIRELTAYGAEFGSHTMTHAGLPTLSDSLMKRELVDSKDAIEQITGQEVVSFSYPYSHVTDRAKRGVREAGYDLAFAVNSGPFRFFADPLEIRRTNVTDAGEGRFKALKLSGAEKTLLWGWWLAKRATGVGPSFEIRRGY